MSDGRDLVVSVLEGVLPKTFVVIEIRARVSICYR